MAKRTKSFREFLNTGSEKPKPSTKSKADVAHAKTLKKLRDLMGKRTDRVIIGQGNEGKYLVEGKWVKVHFDNEIRIDRNTHMRTGEKHAHIHDRKGNELYVVKQDGKPSHNSKPFQLSDKQAETLRNDGFTIPKNNIVEAVLIGPASELLND